MSRQEIRRMLVCRRPCPNRPPAPPCSSASPARSSTAAAQVLAARGGGASMSDVAAAAGVARATVYRYFPNRQVLLAELAELAVRGAGDRLSSARIDEVPVDEGVARAVRALVEVGDPRGARARGRRGGQRGVRGRVGGAAAPPDRRGAGRRTGARRHREPLARRVAHRSRGHVRSSPRALGREDTVAALTSLFLDGAAPATHGGNLSTNDPRRRHGRGPTHRGTRAAARGRRSAPAPARGVPARASQRPSPAVGRSHLRGAAAGRHDAGRDLHRGDGGLRQLRGRAGDRELETLQAYARDLSERIIPRGVETHEVLGIVLLLRDVLARSLFAHYQDDARS